MTTTIIFGSAHQDSYSRSQKALIKNKVLEETL